MKQTNKPTKKKKYKRYFHLINYLQNIEKARVVHDFRKFIACAQLIEMMFRPCFLLSDTAFSNRATFQRINVLPIFWQIVVHFASALPSLTASFIALAFICLGDRFVRLKRHLKSIDA